MTNSANANEILNVGDVVHCSWGYSMTLNDFYIVVGRVGKASVKLEKIGSKWVEGSDGFTGKVVADETVRTGEFLTKRVKTSWNGDARIKISDCQYAYSYDGRAVYENHMD